MILKLKNIILLFFLTTNLAISQKVSLETNFSRSLSGLGDMWGNNIDLGVKYKFFKGFYAKVSFGVGNATSNTFSVSDYKDKLNLLVLDKWTQNYPYLYIQESFNFGSKRLTPSTNFQVYNTSKILIGYDFFKNNKFNFGVSLGICKQKVENTYMSAQIPSKIINIYGEIDGVITVPHVLSFIDYSINYEVYSSYKITKNFKSGIFINLNEGSIRILSAGLKLSAAIVE